MNITFILIALFGASYFLLASYLVSIYLLYKKERKNEPLKLRNTFIYEMTPHFKTSNFFINALLYISTALVLVGFILFTTKYIETITVSIMVTCLLFLACFCFLTQVPLTKLKEHLYLSLGSMVGFFATSGLLTYMSYSMNKLMDWQNVNLIIAIVVSGIIFLASLVFIFFPGLFNLRNEVNEKGESVRPHFLPLAFLEWMILFIYPLILIPLILMSVAI